MAKKELFTRELQDMATFFKALGHPARLEILRYLAETNNCICGDISNELPLGRTTVNQHLKELKTLGLVQGEIDGSRTNYCIRRETLEGWLQQMNQFFKGIKCC